MYNGNDEEVVLESEIGFFDVFTMRNLKRSDIRIPNTLICEQGQWKEWMFNSEKDKSHIILRKHKENLLTFKVVRLSCYLLGCFDAIKDCASVDQIHEKLQGQLKTNINHDAKIAIIYKTSRLQRTIKILDFVKTLANRNYSGHNCPQTWRLVQEVVQFNPRHEEYYYVSAERSSQVANYKFNFLKRIVDEDLYDKVDQENIFRLPQRKDITKTLDQSLTHRQLTLSLKIIDYMETNLKLLIKRIDLKMGINKGKEPFLMSVLKIVNKVSYKFIDVANMKSGGQINIHDFMNLAEKVKNLPDSERKKRMISQQSIKQPQPCSGDLCQVPLKNEIDRRTTLSSGQEVPYDQILRVRKNLRQILVKLKEMQIVTSSEDLFFTKKKEDSDSDDDEMERTKMGFLRKVCKKCYFLYGIINKTIDFDANNNLIEKPQNSLSRNALAMISEGITLPAKRPAKQVTSIDNSKAEPVAPTKNFLRLNMQVLKDGLPSIASAKRLRTLSAKDKSPEQKNPPLRKTRQQKSQSMTKIQPIPKNLPKPKPKAPSYETLPLIQRNNPSPIKQKSNSKVIDYSLQTAKTKLMSSLSWVTATSVSELKDKYEQTYKGFRSRQDFEVQPVEYLMADEKFPNSRRPIYTFQNFSILHEKSQKFRIIQRPTMTLTKLSELSVCPQIIMKNDFIVQALICDEKTTITFCLLSSQMFGNEKGNQAYQNIVIVQDMFDCFLEYLQLAKDLLQNTVNKRIIIFNYPGQSYTTYNQNITYDGLYVCQVLDKLLYRLSEELHLIDIENDSFKFAGFGYGGYITQLYISINQNGFNNIKKIMLVNSFSKIGKGQEKLLKKLQDIYSNKDKVLEEHAYLYYNIAINSSQQTNQQIDNKMILNPINVKGRVFILRNILQSTHDVRSEFQQITIPTLLIYCKENCYVGLQQMNTLAHYANVIRFLTENPTQKIHTRYLLEIQKAGHDILADAPLDLLKSFEEFIQT